MKSITDKISQLKKKHNAFILAHNYQPAEVQDIADFLGDSLDLSRKAAESKADVIVFCGVHFMAQTASILCPDKTILLPEIKAGCPMADMADAVKLRELKKQHPGVPVVCYINTTADVKTESDICCTSANAEKIVNSIKSDKVIFVPDKNLGRYVAQKTNKNLIFWNGHCIVHVNILAQHVKNAKNQHPNAEVLAHPECTQDVIELADKTLSTTGICRYVKQSDKKEFIICTETGIIHRLKKENPGKIFYPGSAHAECMNMKKISLEKVLWALEELKYKVEVSEETRKKARVCIDKMLELSK